MSEILYPWMFPQLTDSARQDVVAAFHSCLDDRSPLYQTDFDSYSMHQAALYFLEHGFPCSTANALATSADGDLALDRTVNADLDPLPLRCVRVNGIQAHLGDGIKTRHCYFSGDSGTTARALSAVTTGDQLYWVGSVAGFELNVGDAVDWG